MEKWIGNRPTLGQKALNKYNKLLDNTQYTLLPDEIVLKIIEAECDKSSGRELKGILLLTNMSVHFISKKEHFHLKYSQINDIDVSTDGKDKNEWKLVLRCGWSNRYFDDIKKNDDSQEFIEILEYKIVNPTKDIQTTVTHDFTFFLHAKRLEELRNKNVKITSFLMKRDNMGFSKNGERLLREKHKNAKLITEGFFKEKKEKKGNFIVVDNNIFLYEYDDKKREVKLIYSWILLFFSNAKIDHFAIRTEVENKEGTLVLKSSGKAFASILIDEGIEFELKIRKWHQKILGFRSGKWWKKATASLFYLFTILLLSIIVFGEGNEKPITTIPETKEVSDSEVRKSEEAERLAEEQRQKEEAERLAEEQRQKKETERLAEEQRQKEEAERLAEEQRQKEEAERLAEEQRQKEEAERLAEEQREAEQQTNVYFKNCDAARSAGAAPVHQGEPGYGKHLDRDGDGIGCDR